MPNDKTASTRVVMLGTGTPRPDPARSGPTTAIVVNDTPYLVDFGPGVIRRATAAYEKGVIALGYGGVNIKTVFLTHMHSDHIAYEIAPSVIYKDRNVTVTAFSVRHEEMVDSFGFRFDTPYAS